MALAKLKGRSTKFNQDILLETDQNGDKISLWCRQANEATGFCVLCDSSINCRQHGVTAIRRHAATKRHIDSANQHRDTSGVVQRPKTTQSTLELTSQRNIPLNDQVTHAETLFVLGMTLKGIPYSWADTATDLYPKMFPDSEIAKKFSCKRSKTSYIVSDGLGSYFKKLVVDELNKADVFYSIAIDETPIPEQRCQQLDVVVRYFSDKAQQVVVEHLQSYRLGSATAEILAGEIQKAMMDLPQKNFICFFTDGPNVMKSLKKKMQEAYPNIIDLGECCLHKVHNSFARGLNAFGSDIEGVVIDVYYFFKNSAVQSAAMKAEQVTLGLPETVFLRHVSSRWLTLGPAVDRLIEQYPAVKKVLLSDTSRRTGGQLRERLRKVFSDKTFYAKLLFIRNVSEIFVSFLSLLQGSEPLVHRLYEEMVFLVQKLLGRFMKTEAYRTVNGKDLPHLDVHCSAMWKAVVEVGGDTEAAMSQWEPAEKKAFRLGARSFYLKATEHLLSRLPFENMALRSLRCLSPKAREEESSEAEMRCLAAKLPQVIQPSEISTLMDEYTVFQLETVESAPRVDKYWQVIFDLKKSDGSHKYPLLNKVVKALLSIPHGNADVERGFSENRRLLHDRARLTVESINGIRHIVSYGKRFDSDPCRFSITPEVVRVVRNAKKLYSERIASEEEQSAKRQRKADEAGSSSGDQADLQKEVETARKMLTNAELLISRGLKSKDFADIESGNSLLAEGKSRLAVSLQKMADSKRRKVAART
ncbi:uncharacterized protein [Dermacentor albipictus]|uniref:uncharacterized protein n=1 Tax=Dermacentor albipictus TaxID=60249 RepID=UPI0038FC20A4